MERCDPLSEHRPRAGHFADNRVRVKPVAVSATCMKTWYQIFAPACCFDVGYRLQFLCSADAVTSRPITEFVPGDLVLHSVPPTADPFETIQVWPLLTTAKTAKRKLRNPFAIVQPRRKAGLAQAARPACTSTAAAAAAAAAAAVQPLALEDVAPELEIDGDGPAIDGGAPEEPEPPGLPDPDAHCPGAEESEHDDEEEARLFFAMLEEPVVCGTECPGSGGAPREPLVDEIDLGEVSMF